MLFTDAGSGQPRRQRDSLRLGGPTYWICVRPMWRQGFLTEPAIPALAGLGDLLVRDVCCTD